MERACRTWLTVLLCWVTTTLALDGGGHRTRSNALGVYGVKNCRGRGGEEEYYNYKAVEGDEVSPDEGEDPLCTWSRVVVVVQPPSSLPSPPPPPPPSGRYPGSQQPPGHHHLPGSPRPWTTYMPRHRHHRLLRPRLTEEEEPPPPPPPSPPLPQATASDSIRGGASSSSSPSHLGHSPSPYQQPPTPPEGAVSTPSLRRRRRRRSPSVFPPKTSFTGESGAPPLLSSGAPLPPRSSSQGDGISRASSDEQQQPLFIPILVPNIPELIPHLRESGLHIPANVSPISVPDGQRVAPPSGQGHGAGPSSSDRQPSLHVRFPPIPPSGETVPPATYHPIHITINIAPGAAASTPLVSSALPQSPSAPSASPPRFSESPLLPETYPYDGEEIPVQFPAVAGHPTRERYHSSTKPYHTAFLPLRYPSSQGAPFASHQPPEEVPPLPSHQPPSPPLVPFDKPSTPQTPLITTRFGLRPSTGRVPTSAPEGAIVFLDDSFPSAAAAAAEGPPQPIPTTAQLANDSRPSQRGQEAEPRPLQEGSIIFPSELLTQTLSDHTVTTTVTGSDLIDFITTHNLLDGRIAIMVPLKSCPGPCGTRHPDTKVCVVDEACESNLRAEMLV